METISENTDIFKFLDGSQDYQGVWYGDKHPTLKGNFWWRSVLKDQIQKRIHAQLSEKSKELRIAVQGGTEFKNKWIKAESKIEEKDKEIDSLKEALKIARESNWIEKK